jgi:hypothetical protein
VTPRVCHRDDRQALETTEFQDPEVLARQILEAMPIAVRLLPLDEVRVSHDVDVLAVAARISWPQSKVYNPTMASPRVTPEILIRLALIVVVVFVLAGVAGLILGIPTMEVLDKYSLGFLLVAAIGGGKLLAPAVKRSRERDD